MKDHKYCHNCGVMGDEDVSLTPINDDNALCPSCLDSYERYMSECQDELLAQERYENFMGEY